MDTATELNEAKLRVKLATTTQNNVELARALVEARLEIASLKAQLAEARATADDLAALVCRFLTAFRFIRPQVGNGARAAIDSVMARVEVPGGSE